jgi:outer membrane protein TolC
VVAESEAEHARIAVQAAMTFVRLQRARLHVDARLADSALAVELLGIAREQLRAGTGITLDVTRAESQLATAQSQLVVARAERARAGLELARLLGLDLDVSIRDQVSAADSMADSVPLSSALQQAAAHRAELRAIDARLAAVRRLEGAVRAERFPALSVFADNGMIGRSASDLKYTYNWGLQLSVPLLDFRRDGRGREQSAMVRELEERRRDVERAVSVEVRSALIDLETSRSQVASAQLRLQLGQRELQQARDRFVAGIAGNVDVVTASLGLNSARTALADALAAQQLARVSLAHAQGLLATLR